MDTVRLFDKYAAMRSNHIREYREGLLPEVGDHDVVTRYDNVDAEISS